MYFLILSKYDNVERCVLDLCYGAESCSHCMWYWNMGNDTTDENMMTSSNANICRVTGHLCGEFTSHRWLPQIKASDPELRCFVWSMPEQTVEYTIETLVVWDAMAYSHAQVYYSSVASAFKLNRLFLLTTIITPKLFIN